MKRQQTRILKATEWRKANASGELCGLARTGTIVRGEGDPAATDEEKPVTFIASTSTPDRYGDIIEQDGWVLDAYRKNPVLLWGHDYSMLPVGKVGTMEVSDGVLRASDIEWTPKEVHEFGATVGRMVRGGFLQTVSVGFMPLEFEPIPSPEKGGQSPGYRFIKSELLELSVVAVPANGEALAEGLAVNSPGAAGFIRQLGAWAKAGAGPWARDAATALEIATAATEAGDQDAFTELLSLTRSLLAEQRKTNASLAVLARQQAKAQHPPAADALRALFSRIK